MIWAGFGKESSLEWPYQRLTIRFLARSHFSCVWLCRTLWTVACQAPLSMDGIFQARILDWVAKPFCRGGLTSTEDKLVLAGSKVASSDPHGSLLTAWWLGFKNECVFVCVCVWSSLSLTFRSPGASLCHTLVVETVTKPHSGSTYSGSRGGNLDTTSWWKSGKVLEEPCGMEILWPFLGSTICHIPVLKHNWYS